MYFFSLLPILFVLQVLPKPCLTGISIDLEDEDNLFGECDMDFKPFRNKCLRVITDTSMGWEEKDYRCMGYPVIIESEEEAQFYFDKLLGGQETYVLQLLMPVGGGFVDVFDFYDIDYITSHDISNEGTYHASNYSLACKIGSNGVKDCKEIHMDAYNMDVAVPCLRPRVLYEGMAHECHMNIKKKFRRDATRTITMKNDMSDICYITIKSRKVTKPSMIKVYGYSFPSSDSCIPGFFITGQTDLDISGTSLPSLKCGEKGGTGNALIKKKTARGGEIRIYFVLDGEGTPVSMRMKGRAF